MQNVFHGLPPKGGSRPPPSCLPRCLRFCRKHFGALHFVDQPYPRQREPLRFRCVCPVLKYVFAGRNISHRHSPFLYMICAGSCPLSLSACIFAILCYAGVRRCGGQAFFDEKSGNAIIKIDTTIPPGYRHVLKNGWLQHTLRFPFFQKKAAAFKFVISTPP